jgi:hypothetical protein
VDHHDLGGSPNTTPISQAQHPLMPWELRVDALLLCLSDPARPGGALMTVDELRRGIESLPADAYATWGYYSRWLHSMLSILAEKGVIDRDAIERRARELADAHEREHA